MRRQLSLTLFCALAVSCFAKEAPPATQGSDSGAKISFAATLEKSLDSKKLKVGDAVSCITSGTLHARNGFLIPSGSKVMGHVTQAEARGKGDANSTLGMAFEKIEVRGKEIPMKGTLQAIAPGLGSAGPSTGAAEPASLGGGGQAAASGAQAGTMAAPTSSMRVSGPANGTPLLIPSSSGVLGFKGLEMDANGVISSPDKQVKLNNGTQMMIRAEIQMPSTQ